MLLVKKVPPDNIMEEYTPLGHQEYGATVGKIKKFAAGAGTAVINTINGDSNVFFFKELAKQGIGPEDVPVMSFSVAEDELRVMDTRPLVGHLACWNYFQSVDTPQNKEFVKNFQAYCQRHKLPGGEDRVTDDPIEAAYFGVYLWKQAVEKAGTSDVDAVRRAAYGIEFLAPGGPIKLDDANHHTSKPVLIGQIQRDGQFKIVWRSTGLVKPEPWSEYTSPDRGCDWVHHQGTYSKRS
jgi:urea transport system substrate-binding protein